MNTRTIVILGKPGSGKGTQARLLSEKTGFPIFAASRELAAFAEEHPRIGERIRYDMNRGTLVPHWLMSFLLIRKMVSISPNDGFIFDGAVRKIEEAKLFDEVMEWLGRAYVVIYLALNDEELRVRLVKRANIENRTDDTDAIITERLAEYRRNTEGSLEFFKSRGNLIEINGEGLVEEIHANILAALERV